MGDKLTAACIAAGVLVVFGGVIVGSVDQGPMRDTVIKITPPRTAVDMEFVIDRDDNGDIVKIHRFVLWSNGNVSFPDIPYWPKLVFDCRDCAPQPSPCPEDIDGDGVVAIPDLLLLNAAMGKTCPE